MELWWNPHFSFVILLLHPMQLPNSHWYGCHGKECRLGACEVEIWCAAILWLFPFGAGDSLDTCKDWMTDDNCQLICHSPALQARHILSCNCTADKKHKWVVICAVAGIQIRKVSESPRLTVLVWMYLWNVHILLHTGDNFDHTMSRVASHSYPAFHFQE